MNNREKLNQMSDEELAEKVCDFINAVADKADIDDMCDICPFKYGGKNKHGIENGITDIFVAIMLGNVAYNSAIIAIRITKAIASTVSFFCVAIVHFQ